MKKRKKYKIKFTERKQSVRGMISAGIGILAVLLTMYVTYRTTRSQGNSGLVVGAAGFFLVALTLAGVITSAYSFKQKEVYYTWSIVGMVLNGILLVGFIFLYFLGLSI